MLLHTAGMYQLWYCLQAVLPRQGQRHHRPKTVSKLIFVLYFNFLCTWNEAHLFLDPFLVAPAAKYTCRNHPNIVFGHTNTIFKSKCHPS